MNKLFFLLSFFLISAFCSSSSLGQIVFKKGYIFDNQNDAKEVWIKDVGWKNNPFTFEYKTQEEGEILEGNLENISAFQIGESVRYERHSVNIDQSDSKLSNLSEQRAPEWRTVTVFLKVLVSGYGTLYYYEADNMFRYFYSVDNAFPKQLINKEYRAGDKILTNRTYLNQLYTEINCGNTTDAEIKKVGYERRHLMKYFRNFNECHGQEGIVYVDETGRDKINFRVNLGVNQSSTTLSTLYRGYGDVDFGSQLSMRAGIEMEYIPPFNRNKWGVLLEPAYQSYSGESVFENEIPVEIVYKSIEFSVGLRHYFFLNDKSRLFVNGHLISNFSIEMDSKITYRDVTLDIKPQNSWSIGAGYMWGRLSIESRFVFKRNVVHFYQYWRSNHQRISAIVAFRI